MLIWNFAKLRCFCQISTRYIPTTLSILYLAENDQCLKENNLSSLIDRNLFYTSIDR